MCEAAASGGSPFCCYGHPTEQDSAQMTPAELIGSAGMGQLMLGSHRARSTISLRKAVVQVQVHGAELTRKSDGDAHNVS